jgi:hypothetical protein
MTKKEPVVERLFDFGTYLVPRMLASKLPRWVKFTLLVPTGVITIPLALVCGIISIPFLLWDMTDV